MQTFDFANERKATNSIDIDNIGDFCLEAINEDDNYYFYLMVKTTLGVASVACYGPIVPDVELLPSGYTARFERFDFNDKKMSLWISKWLNDRSKNITAAYIVEEKDFKNNYRDLKDYIDSYSDEVY